MHTIFTTDASTHQPGKMGWGTELHSDAQRLSKEQIAFGELQQSMPSMVQRRPARDVVNDKLLSTVQQLQEKDGIDEGFSFLHLERAIFGEVIPWKKQIIGSCVASGGVYADVGRACVEAFLVQQPEQLFGDEWVGPDNIAPFAPYNYRAGRYFGNLNGNMDGSFCAEHIQGKLEYGYVTCAQVQEELGYQDTWYPEPQSSSEYRRWGANNKLLDQFKPKAKFRLIETEKVKDAADGLTLQTEHFKPMQICSNWGFAPTSTIAGWTFLGEPVYQYRRRGNWAHNMTIYGCVKVRNNWWVIIRNSWGFNAHRNGCWFAISIEDWDQWLRQAECMSIGDMDLPDIEFGNPFDI